MPDQMDRRRVVASLGAAGLAAAVAGCGGGSNGSDGGETTSATQAPASTAGAALGSASEVPAGGGKVFDAQKVVVTQPSEGDYKAFSAVCTHQGCLVSSVANDQIICACHNSHYSARDGSVITGPATRPLSSVAIQVINGTIVLA